MATLEILRGPGLGRLAVIGEAALTIGRDAACGMRLDDGRSSRVHAEIRQDGPDRFLLRDEGSSNGTILNGRRLEAETALRDGDEIEIGQTMLRFVLRGAAPREAAEPATILRTLDTQDLPLLKDDAPAGRAGALRFLLDLSRAAVEADRPETLAAVLADGLARQIAADRVFLFVGRDAAMEPVERKLPPALRTAYKAPYSRTVLAEASAKKVAVLSAVAGDDRFRDARSVARAAIASAICVPLLAGDELLGALYLDRLGDSPPFEAGDLELAAAAGTHCAMALLNLRRLEELRASRDRLETELNGPAGFVGDAPALRAIYDFIERAAPTDAGILILGESGTGKELVARAIHRASARVDRPFVIVNCAALAESLAEAELFGHERGAFTGADRARPGRFAAADGGTLFLDEIGELSEPIQAKLLRVLESGEIAPVGEAGVRHVDVRVIAATNRDLAAEAERGRFRRDLYYRLNILRVELPPLRNRLDDVPLLVEHFLRFFGARTGRPHLTIDAEAMTLCRRHPWPGNVRELKNAVERMVILARGDRILASDLPPEICGGGTGRPSAAPGALRPLTEVEREHILAVLAAERNNKKRAAEILGIDRSTLYAKLKQYGVDPEGAATP